MSLFYGHVSLMVTGFLLMAAGVGIAMFLRQKRWWLKFHKTIGVTGVACLVAGFATAVAMVSQSGDGQFKAPHAWMGLATLLVAVAAPIVGQLQFKIRSKTQPLRLAHRWAGRVTLAMTFLAALSGLRIAGIL
jgi:hypothetical protein